MLEVMDKKATKASLQKVMNLARKADEFLVAHGENLIRLTKTGDGAVPQDLAQMSFWQFVKSTRGTSLMEMLSLAGKFIMEKINSFLFYKNRAP